MASAPSPDEGMTMRVPVGGRLLHGLPDLGPRLDASPLEGQRAPHLPPGRDEVQGGRLVRREDELPARVRQREHQDSGGPLSAQVIPDGIDPLHVRRNPGRPRARTSTSCAVVRPAWGAVSASPSAGVTAPKRSPLPRRPSSSSWTARPAGLAGALGPIAVVGASLGLAEVAAGMGSSRARAAGP